MITKKKERKKGVVALVILSLVFASMGIFVRYLQSDFTILQQTYLRIFTACIIGLIIFYKDLDFRKISLITLKEWSLLSLRSITLYVIGVALLSQAYTLTRYSNVSFIGALPLTAVFGFLLLKEKITWQKILYIIIGFIGVVVIAVKDYSHLLNWGLGETLTLIATLSFTISYIARKWQGSLLNNKEIAVLIFLISSLLLFFTSLCFGEHIPHGSVFSVPIVLIIIVAGSFNVANLFLTNYGFQKVEAVLAGNLLMLEVVFAVIIGYIFFGEIPSAKDALGGLLILLSAYMMNKLS